MTGLLIGSYRPGWAVICGICGSFADRDSLFPHIPMRTHVVHHAFSENKRTTCRWCSGQLSSRCCKRDMLMCLALRGPGVNSGKVGWFDKVSAAVVVVSAAVVVVSVILLQVLFTDDLLCTWYTILLCIQM